MATWPTPTNNNRIPPTWPAHSRRAHRKHISWSQPSTATLTGLSMQMWHVALSQLVAAPPQPAAWGLAGATAPPLLLLSPATSWGSAGLAAPLVEEEAALAMAGAPGSRAGLVGVEGGSGGGGPRSRTSMRLPTSSSSRLSDSASAESRAQRQLSTGSEGQQDPEAACTCAQPPFPPCTHHGAPRATFSCTRPPPTGLAPSLSPPRLASPPGLPRPVPTNPPRRSHLLALPDPSAAPQSWSASAAAPHCSALQSWPL